MKLGIIGLNEGNGHPYSYSAIFNGYDPEALQAECPFALIKDYLPKEHRNENEIKNAKVTHIWTQTRELSESVARVSLIPNIVNDPQDLISQVDGVILARDDIENHFKMAAPFIKKGLPIFIDKQLTASPDELHSLMQLCQNIEYPLMACSPIRYNPTLLNLAKKRPTQPKSIQGISRVNWLRYAHHLFEGIAILYGIDIDYVQYLGFDEKHESYLIKYKNDLTVTLEFHLEVQLPIRCFIYSSDSPHVEMQFADFFKSFKGMLQDFVKVVETKKPIIPFDEMFGIASVILAGVESKQNHGTKISPSKFRNLYAY